MGDTNHPATIWFTDKQLCERWHCTDRTLHRYRLRGKLEQPLKRGGFGINLTHRRAVEAFEQGEASA